MSKAGDSESGKKRFRLSENFFGTATVGERGQIVIPAEARKKFDIETGDKLLIVGHGDKGIMLFKIDALREFMNTVMEDLQRVEKEYQKSDRVEDAS
ncbi:MAG: AbrB/MazE/SpoVT family DNA-binding domain-containing protein [Armatimonadetes bacterium]|nr:AbrB/MazE/SpoVT family DNA-binding domain-containing protein [Armatimonadota bacterium]